ncbi:MAG: UvrB/UvrC motif-containing protein, partial [Candidatus Taylorbacteria bacterium]|nr:UvrB/UvrC motif-containing protein [Candidatus Taylorbacteria bacterium]
HVPVAEFIEGPAADKRLDSFFIHPVRSRGTLRALAASYGMKNPEFTKEQKNDYQKNIKAVRNILNGKRIYVLKNLEKEMSRLAKKDDFEKAIDLRNKISQLQRVFKNAKVIKELAGKEKVLAELQKTLNLPTLPHRIEGYDISNIQGQFATGSMVVFTNGQPDKNEYRKFKIQISGHSDDTGMLKEMLTRRFKHPEWQFPDLIVIDGGKGQLNTTLSVIPINISVIALTKDERHKGHHIFSGTKKTAMPLFDLPDPVKNFILQVDEEAHRFAISYYRKLHRRIINI